MSLVLKEGIDFEWDRETVKNGFNHPVTCPRIGKRLLHPIHDPEKNSIVYYVTDAQTLTPVLISSGNWLVGGRLSNFWYWHPVNDDLSLGEEQHGYGSFFLPHLPFQVEIVKKVTLAFPG